MNVFLTWTDLKAQVVDKAKVRYVEHDAHYSIQYLDLESSILFTNTTDKNDFDTNYKSSANKAASPTVSIEKIAPFGAKTIVAGGVEKKLYARNTGIQWALVQGANQIDFTISYPWVKILGVEVINAEALDYTDLKVLDAASNPYFGTPSAVLNQFAYSNNIGKDFYVRVAQFDADIYQNMVIRLNYTSVSAKTVGFNFVMFEVKS